MTVEQLITELRCNDARRRLKVSEAAADMLELLEERIAIMGEALSAEEWQQQEQDARQRINGRQTAAAAGRVEHPPAVRLF